MSSAAIFVWPFKGQSPMSIQGSYLQYIQYYHIKCSYGSACGCGYVGGGGGGEGAA